MFWFRHPTPFKRKEVAVQMVARKGPAPASPTSITVQLRQVDVPHLPAAGDSGAPADAIAFSVRYRVSEYLSFVHQHVLALISAGSKFNPRRHLELSLALAGLLALVALGGMASGAGGLSLWSGVVAGLALAYAACNTGPGLKFQIAVFCTPVFLLKRHYMPECRFTIDAASIERVTARGTMLVPWSDIVAVHTYSLGYMLMTKRGGAPIPRRCLSAAQASRLRALVAAHRARQAGAAPVAMAAAR